MDLINSSDIDAPASAAWNLLGEQFADIGSWATLVFESSLEGPLGVGAVRTCRLKSGQLDERLTVFDRESQTLTYQIENGRPPILRSLQNHWTVESDGDTKSRVTSHITLKLAWWALPLAPLLRFGVNRSVRPFLEEFRQKVEAEHGAAELRATA